MKRPVHSHRRNWFLIPLFPFVATAAAAPWVSGATTVSDAQRFTWNENTGWMNWRDANAGLQGARLHQGHMTGFVWSESTGWMSLGNGQPFGGAYANTDHTNFGVNIDPQSGTCSGYAWGENIGWVLFDTASSLGPLGARYEFSTGRFRGFAWSENTGWVNLDAGTGLCSFGADLNADGVINTLDLTIFLGTFGVPANLGGKGDLNGDGQVNTTDLVSFLGQFGKSCG